MSLPSVGNSLDKLFTLVAIAAYNHIATEPVVEAYRRGFLRLCTFEGPVEG